MNAQKEIPLTVVGYDFAHASAHWRSVLPLDEEEKNQLYRELQNEQLVNGLTFLDTCNRNEWIVSTEKPNWAAQLLRAQMVKRLRDKFSIQEVPEPFVYSGKQALQHILRVSSGLESFVQGEKQIAGQLNTAFREARKNQRSDAVLNRLSTLSGKAARETSGLGVFQRSIRGVHDLAVKYLLKFLNPQHAHNILVVGYGEIARHTIDSLHYHTAWKIKIVNRTLPQENPLQIRPLSQMFSLLQECDAAIFCTGASSPLFTQQLWQELSVQKKSKWIILDMGIPSQVENFHPPANDLQIANLDVLMDSGLIQLADKNNLAKIETTLETLTREYERFIQEREMIPVLASAQNTHENYIHNIIPTLLENEFPELSEPLRAKLVFRLRGLVREYTNTIIESVHAQGEKKLKI